jgi:hypothetical protein
VKKYYYLGDHKCYSWMKKVGANWEVSFYFGKEKMFFGNFIHKTEATAWYRTMTKQLHGFTRKHAWREGSPVMFYKKLMKNFVYNNYYAFLDTRFTTYQRTYSKSFRADIKKFKQYTKRYATHDKWHLQAA